MEIASTVNYFDIMDKARKSYGRLLLPICNAFDLTRNEMDVLLFLYNNPQYDRATDIVARRGMAKSHVSLSVTNLEGKGFLYRRFDNADRRTAHLILTEQGREVAQKAREVQEIFFSALYRDVSEEEFALWRKITDKVSGNIQNLDKTLTID